VGTSTISFSTGRGWTPQRGRRYGIGFIPVSAMPSLPVLIRPAELHGTTTMKAAQPST